MNYGLKKSQLALLYEKQKLSVKEIAKRLKCSETKVNYWLGKHGINKRSISEALYVAHNPKGDPFFFKEPHTTEQWFLYGLGLGLYWGEGNKRNKYSIRLGNTDPKLVKLFLRVLREIYTAEEQRLRFSLQIFSDMSPDKALDFWSKYLQVSKEKFGKVVVTPARSLGTYREKTQHGVLTICISNKRLRDVICSQIEKL